jgi:hypothetical protein
MADELPPLVYVRFRRLGSRGLAVFCVPTALDPACFWPIPGPFSRWGLLLSSHLDAVELGVS